MHRVEVVVIGAGQAGLAAAYFLRRAERDYLLLDAESQSGGAWQHTWPSLKLFSPARWSSLPGWLMPATAATYPTREETLQYLAAYEARYTFPIERGVRVHSAHGEGDRIQLETSAGPLSASAVISATGSWSQPLRPHFDGAELFGGRIIHSAEYRGPSEFAGLRVLVVGAGNSGAQIFADLVDHADVTWVTKDPPVFLPDDVDGQVLFDQATARYRAQQQGLAPPPPRSLGDIVMVESVKAVRERGLLLARPLFRAFTPDGVLWDNGDEEHIDAVIPATGFKPALAHLAPLATPDERGRLPMQGLHAAAHPRLFPLGYGDWTGFASATLVGVGRRAKEIVEAIVKGGAQ